MKTIFSISFPTILVSTLCTLACDKESAEKAAPEATSAEAPASPSSGQDAAEWAPLFAAYEQARQALADDRLEDVAGPAKELRDSARRAFEQAPPALRAQLGAVAQAADGLHTAPAADAQALRKAFGEVSRPLVSLVEAEPKLAAGKHLFECPMAEGYKKWIQVDDAISNPYMGKSMLACGAPAKWQ